MRLTSTWNTWLGLGLGALLCLGGRALRLYDVELHRSGQRYEDIYYLPAPSALAVLSLGFHDALADLLWSKSLVYFGEELSHRGQVKYVFQYTDAILALDPDFKRAYSWVATAALYRPTLITMEDGLHAASYLERAVERWPDDGELRWDYGSLLRFELAPLEKDRGRKRALLERAAPQLDMAAKLGAGPPWLALNNADLLDKLGHTEQAIRHLEELRDRIDDPDVKRDLELKLDMLHAHTYAEAMRAAETELEAQRRAEFPSVSPELYLWLGPPPDLAAYDAFVARGFMPEPPSPELDD